MTTETIDRPPSRTRGDGQGFTIYRAGQAAPLPTVEERGMHRAGYVPHPAMIRGMTQLVEKGVARGAETRVLLSSPNLHVTYVWFKSGFPLPLHSHDADCFYQIIAGSMDVGTEEVRKGDSVFVPAGAPYSFTPGDEGVEFLEIRTSDNFDTVYRATTDVYWDRLATKVTARQDAWETEQQPYGLIPIQG